MMTQRTNPTARASKCRDLARQLVDEAGRWPQSSVRRKLTAAAIQLGYLARASHAIDAAQTEAYIETAEGMLATIMTARGFGEAV